MKLKMLVQATALASAVSIGATAAVHLPDLLRDTPPHSVIFHGPSIPQRAAANAPLPVAFIDVERTQICHAVGVVRYRVDIEGSPGRLTNKYGMDHFPIVPIGSAGKGDFSAVLETVLVPNEPGRVLWYHPIIQPGDDCLRTDPILPPPMMLTIMPSDWVAGEEAE